MKEEKKDIVEYDNGEISFRNDTSVKKYKHDFELPPEIMDAVAKALQGKQKFKQEIQAVGETAQSLWEVIVTPEFQEGISNGELIIKKGSIEIRNATTGRFVGKAKLQEAERHMRKVKQTTDLSNISRSICTLSGQMQVAEISRRLEAIDEKIEHINEFLWREKVSTLNGIKSVIEEAIDSLPNQRAIERVNACIAELIILSNFFEATIEDILKRKIQHSLKEDFIEGLKVWDIFNKNRTEYNSNYIKKSKELIDEFGFLIEIYFQTLGLIGTCYQVIGEYQNSKRYYTTLSEKVKLYSLELANKLVYIFNIKDISIDEKITLSDIHEKLETRKLPLIDSVKENEVIIESANQMHDRLSDTQFKNVKVSYLVDPKIIWGSDSDD